MPGDPQKVLVTSNDSRLRVYDDLELCAKYKGLSNCTTLFNLFHKKKKKNCTSYADFTFASSRAIFASLLTFTIST
jgi:hypothetical protein